MLPLLAKGMAIREVRRKAMWEGVNLGGVSARVGFCIGPLHSHLGARFALCNPFAMIQRGRQTSVLWVFWQWSLKPVGSESRSFGHSALLGLKEASPSVTFQQAGKGPRSASPSLGGKSKLKKKKKHKSWQLG